MGREVGKAKDGGGGGEGEGEGEGAGDEEGVVVVLNREDDVLAE